MKIVDATMSQSSVSTVFVLKMEDGRELSFSFEQGRGWTDNVMLFQSSNDSRGERVNMTDVYVSVDQFVPHRDHG